MLLNSWCSFRMKWRVVRMSWGRSVLLLVMILVCLQLLHMVLLGRLESRNNELQQTNILKRLEDDVQQLYVAMRTAVQSARIVDSSGIYKIVNKIVPGYKAEHPAAAERKQVALVTQCSVSHLYQLVDLVLQWQGPISVAVFSPGSHSVTALDTIVRLHRCLPEFRRRVSVHLVFPLTQEPRDIPTTLPALTADISCTNLASQLKQLLYKNPNYVLGDTLKYPNNLLRNVALNNVKVEYVLVIDIDIIPSKHLHNQFIEFIHTNSLLSSGNSDMFNQVNRTAFVVPSFEIDPDMLVPQSKDELCHMWQQGSVRPFYYETCQKCQTQTDYEAWRKLSSSDHLQVAYEVPWIDPWEPFYIAAVTMPRYDERFKQYGFNRISQVCIEKRKIKVLI